MRLFDSHTFMRKVKVYEDPTGSKKHHNEILARCAALSGKCMFAVDGPSSHTSRVAKRIGVDPNNIYTVTNDVDYDQMKKSAPKGVHTYNADVMRMFQTDYGDETYPVDQTLRIPDIPFGVMYFDLMKCTPNSQHPSLYDELSNFIDTLVSCKYIEKGSIFAWTTSVHAWTTSVRNTYCTDVDELKETFETLFKRFNIVANVLKYYKYHKHMCFIMILLC